MAALLSDKLVWFDAGRPGTDPTKFANLGTGGSAYDALVGGVVLNPLTMAYFNKTLGALVTPGVTGNYARAFDRPSLDVTGDIEIVMHLAVPDWTPSANQILLSKRGAAGNVSWNLNLLTAGTLQFNWSADGTTVISKASTVATGATDTTAIWIKVTLDVDNGAVGNTVKFFTSTDGTNWTTLGDEVVTAATTSIFASTANLDVAAHSAGTAYYAMTVYRAIVKNGIDGSAVADFNPDLDAWWPFETWVGSVGGEGWTVLSPLIYTTARPKRLRHLGRNYLWTPGLASNFASTPDAPVLDLAADIEVQWFGALDSIGATGTLVSKYGAAGQRSFALGLTAANLLRFVASSDGTALDTDASSTVAWTAIAGMAQDVGFKVTFDASDGLGNHVVTFYYSLNDGATWTQLGAAVTAAANHAVFNSTATVVVGFNTNFSASTGDVGKHYRAVIKSGINGTTVFDVDFTKLTSATQTTITEQSANAANVTIGRATTGRKSVAVVRDVVNFGTDDFWELSPDPLGAFVTMPGTSGNYISTPDSAALDILGDLTIDVKVVMDDWTPAANAVLVNKYTTAGNRSFFFFIDTSGRPCLTTSTDGTATVANVCATPTGFTDGTVHWLRVSYDVNDGGGNRVARFYTSTDGITWTLLDTTTTAVVTTIFASVAPLEIGSQGNGTAFLWAGKVYQAKVYASDLLAAAGTPVAAFAAYGLAAAGMDYTNQTSGEAWTLNGTAAVSNTNPLNLAPTSGLSVLASVRQWATVGTEALVSKRDGAGAAGDSGWALYAAAGPLTDFAVDDGTNRPLDTQTSVNGALELKAGVRDVTADTAGAMVDGVGAGVSDTTTAAATNGLGVRIGRLAGAGTSYLSGELLAVVIDPSVISNADQVTLAAAISAQGTQTAEDLRTRYHGGRLLSTTAA